MAKNIVIILLGLFLSISGFLLVRAYSSIDQLEFSLAEWSAALGQTQAELEQTKAQLERTRIELEGLETQLAETAFELVQLQREHALLRMTAEENKFFFYYVPFAEQQYGISNLEKCLSRWQWKDAYEFSVFDCSEMSACIEWMLENEGLHTVIVVGKSPDGSGERHAWLLVEASPGKYMPVEATAFSIVYWGNPYFDKYFKYDHQFETIQEALAYSPTEFDWWEL